VVGDPFRATDRKTGKTIAVRVFPRGSFATAPEIEALRQTIKAAATLTHKNIVATFGMGVDPGGVKFVATELVDGRTLSEVLDERRAAGHAFSAHAAYNVVALVCNAVGYAQTKLANILFTSELARRLGATSGVTANSFHPGLVATAFNRNNGALMRAGMTLVRPFARTPAQGADTLVWLVDSPDVDELTGLYFVDRKPAAPSPAALDEGTARRLWIVSEDRILPG